MPNNEVHNTRSWSVKKRYEGAYTGGVTATTSLKGGQVVATLHEDNVVLFNVHTGEIERILGQDSLHTTESTNDTPQDAITSFAIHPSQPFAVTASRSLIMKHWNIETGECIRTWKAYHKTPILTMAYDASGSLVATGGSDRLVMVFDVEGGYATHSFRGHESIVHYVQFHPDAKKLWLVSASDDGHVRIWNLVAQSCIATLKEHYSPVTGVVWSHDGHFMVSAGRDKVFNVWNSSNNTFQLRSTLPVYESIECLVTLPGTLSAGDPLDTDGVYFASGGDRGLARVWKLQTTQNGKTECSLVAKYNLSSQHVHLGSNADKVTAASDHIKQQLIVYSQQDKDWRLVSCTGGYVLEFLRLRQSEMITKTPKKSGEANLKLKEPNSSLLQRSFELRAAKSVIGHYDEILALKFLPPNPAVMRSLHPSQTSNLQPSDTSGSIVAMSTNSEQWALVDVESRHSRLFMGHSDIILTLDVSADGRYVATAGKDCSVRVWDVVMGHCVAVGTGHTESVGAVCLPARKSTYSSHNTPFIISGSKDKTLKRWDMRPLLKQNATDEKHEPIALNATAAVHAHDKDINCVASAPNDRLIASASQDKTIKLWSSSDLTLSGVLRGHKRGVWNIAFSNTEKVLASSSGDRTIRLWSMTDLSCVRTFEGHTASVLKVQFLSAGRQLMSAGADGLVKLWSVADNECVNTFDVHSSRVWALDVIQTPPSNESSGKKLIENSDNSSTDSDSAENSGESDVESMENVSNTSNKWNGVMVTGGADGILNVWEDVTAEEIEQEQEATALMAVKQQKLYNAMLTRRYKDAVVLCIDLEHTSRLRDILTELLDVGPVPSLLDNPNDLTSASFASNSSVKKWQEAMHGEYRAMAAEALGNDTYNEAFESLIFQGVGKGPTAGSKELTSILRELSTEHLNALFICLRDWNTQIRSVICAQRVLRLVLRCLRRSTLEACSEFLPSVAALLPYTQRHMDRLDKQLQSSYLLNYVISGMRSVAPDDALITTTANAHPNKTETQLSSDEEENNASSAESQSDSSDDDEQNQEQHTKTPPKKTKATPAKRTRSTSKTDKFATPIRRSRRIRQKIA